jgi:WD40 repeat protein
VFRTLPAEAYTRGLAYAKDGKYIASVSASGFVQVWDTATGASMCRDRLRKAAPKVHACMHLTL